MAKKYIKKIQQYAALVGKVFDSLTNNSANDAPSIRAVNAALKLKSDNDHKHTKSDITNFDHTHVAGDIVSGILPLTRGGTGASTSYQALRNLGVTATAAQLSYMSGATGNIQNQLNNKAPLEHGHNVSDIIDFPLALKNPYALKLLINGTLKEQYDGSSTISFNIDVTPIGCIVEFNDEKTNPQNLYGGTWQLIEKNHPTYTIVDSIVKDANGTDFIDLISWSQIVMKFQEQYNIIPMSQDTSEDNGNNNTVFVDVSNGHVEASYVKMYNIQWATRSGERVIVVVFDGNAPSGQRVRINFKMTYVDKTITYYKWKRTA